jgi:hypothetical protein
MPKALRADRVDVVNSALVEVPPIHQRSFCEEGVVGSEVNFTTEEDERWSLRKLEWAGRVQLRGAGSSQTEEPAWVLCL